MKHRKMLLQALLCFVLAFGLVLPASDASAASPGILVASGATSTGENGSRQLARTSDGVLHCVYERPDGPYSQIYYAYSGDGGETWIEEQLTTASRYHRRPSIATDSKDYIHVVWADRDEASTWGRKCTIQYRVRTTSWQPIENVITSYGELPAIAIDSEDNVHLVLSGTWGGAYNCDDAKYMKRTASGWTAVEKVSTQCWAGGPAIAIDKNNDVHVVYVNAPLSGNNYGLRYRKRTGSGWATEYVIEPNDSCADSPAIAIDSNNHLHIIWHWTDRSTGDRVIKYLRFTDSWQPVEVLEGPVSYYVYRASISVDGSDNLYVVWQGRHSGSPDHYQIRYKEYSADSWGSVQDLTCASVDQTCPSLIWAWWPSVDGLRCNIPESGYAFVWNDGPDVRFYRSSDLAWEEVTVCVATATGSGTACLTPSHGTIEDLEALPAIPPGAPAGIMFPHGMFSFKVTGLTPGQTVTITIELPEPVRRGTRWWKERMGAWRSIPVDIIAPNIITITLTDGVYPGDADSVPGQITDPGGPAYLGSVVGWETYPINKASVLLPWIALLAVIMAGASLLVLRHRGRGRKYV